MFQHVRQTQLHVELQHLVVLNVTLPLSLSFSSDVNEIILLQPLWRSVLTDLSCLTDSPSLWGVRRTTALMDGQWGETRLKERCLSVEITGDDQLVLHVPSTSSSPGTVEFTGVSPPRQTVPASTSLSLVRWGWGVALTGSDTAAWSAAPSLLVLWLLL